MKKILPIGLLIFPLVINNSFALGQHKKRLIKPIEITDAWIRGTVPSMSASSGYLTIQNNTDKLDCLLSVSAKTISEHTSLHNTTIDEYGMINMNKINEICIPPHKIVSLVPNKMHIMFMRLRSQLKLGNEVPLILKFKNAGTIYTRAEIQSINYTGKEQSINDK